MKPYSALTQRGRLRRLRQLANRALNLYGVTPVKLALLGHVDNVVFRVDTTAPGERYALRIHRPGKHGKDDIQQEVDWLTAIRRATSLIVPEPVPSLRDSYVTEVVTPGVPDGRHCVLFRWVAGRFHSRDSLSLSQMERVGALTARLHNHGSAFAAASNSALRPYERAFFGSQGMTPWDRTNVYTEAQFRVLDSAETQIRDDIREMGRGSDVFGMIHGDLHTGNYLFDREDVHAIDFDDCGVGHFLFDLTTSLSYLTYRPDSADLRDALIRGYSQERTLHDGYASEFGTFSALRVFIYIHWVLSWDNPTHRPWGPRYLQEAITRLRGFLGNPGEPYRLT